MMNKIINIHKSEWQYMVFASYRFNVTLIVLLNDETTIQVKIEYTNPQTLTDFLEKFKQLNDKANGKN